MNRSPHIGQVQFAPIKSSLYVFIWNMDLRLGEHLLASGDFRAEQVIRRCQPEGQGSGSFRLIDIRASKAFQQRRCA